MFLKYEKPLKLIKDSSRFKKNISFLKYISNYLPLFTEIIKFSQLPLSVTLFCESSNFGTAGNS